MVVNIIKPRLEETFELVKERLDASGLGRVAGHARGADRRRQPAFRRARDGGAHPRPPGAPGPAGAAARPAGFRAAGPPSPPPSGLLAWAAGEGRTLADIDLDADRPARLCSAASSIFCGSACDADANWNAALQDHDPLGGRMPMTLNLTDPPQTCTPTSRPRITVDRRRRRRHQRRRQHDRDEPAGRRVRRCQHRCAAAAALARGPAHPARPAHHPGARRRREAGDRPRRGRGGGGRAVPPPRRRAHGVHHRRHGRRHRHGCGAGDRAAWRASATSSPSAW